MAESSLKELKSSLTLDLSATTGRRITTTTTTTTTSLQTPDLIKLIRSPDIEKLITGSLNNAVTTPTPTKVLYPQEVTPAQRQYVQGFLDALASIQQLNGFVPPATNLLSPGFITPLVSSSSTTIDTSKSSTAIASSLLPSPTRDSISVIMQQMSSIPGYGLMPPPQLHFPSSIQVPQLKTEAPPPPPPPSVIEESKEFGETSSGYVDDTEQPGSSRPSVVTSPSRSSDQEMLMSGYSPGFDLDEQDKKKLDRKRARNRMAATKCRQRKMEKIKDLEAIVADEKRRAVVLGTQIEVLRRQVVALEAQTRSHQ